MEKFGNNHLTLQSFFLLTKHVKSGFFYFSQNNFLIFYFYQFITDKDMQLLYILTFFLNPSKYQTRNGSIWNVKQKKTL